MEQRQKILLIVDLLVVLFIAGIVGFMVVSDGGSSSSGSDSNRTIFVIVISQIPIWISVAVAVREDRKKKEAAGRKRKEKSRYDSYEGDDFEDKVLSAYDGEIIGYDEVEEKST